MEVTFLGTGAAEGVPALFCRCAYCNAVRQRGGREIRSRAQVLLGGELSVDFPPDAFYHAAVLGADLSAVKYLFVTHSHMDHFNAHEFVLRGYKYACDPTSPTLDIFGNEEVCEVYEESVRREMKEEVRSTIRLHVLKPFSPVLCGEWRVHPLRARHSSKEPLLFLFEKGGKRILHLTDTGTLTEESLSYLAALGGKPYDLVILDCTFLFSPTQEGARHMGLDENVRTLRRLEERGLADGKTKRVITHFSHNAAPSLEALASAEAQFGVIAAFDGMELEL